MIKLSKRLEAVAALVTCGGVLADVGADHGYLPIALFLQGKISRAIATDIGRGPLARAAEHIVQYGAEEYIETRLSDGVAALTPGEADSIVIAGMGGGLVIHILTEGETVCRAAKELILQPQSETERVRFFLREQGYVTEAEEMVAEDGKYYPMMRVCSAKRNDRTSVISMPGRAGNVSAADGYAAGMQADAERRRLWDRYGRILLEGHHPVLREYLLRERSIQTKILENLRGQEATGQIKTRIREVEDDLRKNGAALAYDKTE